MAHRDPTPLDRLESLAVAATIRRNLAAQAFCKAALVLVRLEAQR
jgi:hypothetical protein